MSLPTPYNTDLRIGDRVEVDHPDAAGYAGVVVLIEGVLTAGGDPTVWLDMSPAACSHYIYTLAHLPASWYPEGQTVHALNKYPASICRKLKAKPTINPDACRHGFYHERDSCRQCDAAYDRASEAGHDFGCGACYDEVCDCGLNDNSHMEEDEG